ncbi:MAG: putative TIM-barrel fold metal-dependent hydrolase [Candidatus Poriferisodalaceae bacterium]|jgi:predicted TIM-barrel fold metal-dependent hydrolase
MISADSHIVEPAEVFAGLVDRFGDDAPRLVTHEGKPDLMHVPATGLVSLSPTRVALAGYRAWGPLAVDPGLTDKPDPEDPTHPYVEELTQGGYEALPSGVADPVARLDDQDHDGVEAEVLYPSLFFSVFGLPATEVVVAAFANYNAWLRDYCASAPDRLIGAALIPLHDPDAGLAALESALAEGAKTACIPCRAPADRPYRDEAYAPIWALAEEAGVPLAMHIGTNAFAPRGQRQGGSRRPSNPIGDYAGAASVIQATVAELICQGVAHRHPNLQFVVSEFNAGWVPNWLERLDQGWMRDKSAASVDLDRAPSGYWATNFKATIEDDRSSVLCRELIGVDNLMWGNDYPHRDSTWPVSRGVIANVFDGVPADERDRIIDGTARALYCL